MNMVMGSRTYHVVSSMSTIEDAFVDAMSHEVAVAGIRTRCIVLVRDYTATNLWYW